MYRLWVGIDVPKDFFSTASIDSEGNKSFLGSASKHYCLLITLCFHPTFLNA